MSDSCSNGPRRLLVVDDDRDIAQLIGRIATEAGFEARVLTDPLEFMAVFDAFAPDVVSIDILMPRIEGIELVEWVVARRSDVRILIVSGSDPLYAEIANLMADAKGAERLEYLPKPVDVGALDELLRGMALVSL